MEISAAELLYRGVFLPVSVAVTVLKTLTGQLRADISAVRPKFYTPWGKLSSSTMVLSGPLVDIAPGFGGHRVWRLSFQRPGFQSNLRCNLLTKQLQERIPILRLLEWI